MVMSLISAAVSTVGSAISSAVASIGPAVSSFVATVAPTISAVMEAVKPYIAVVSNFANLCIPMKSASDSSPKTATYSDQLAPVSVTGSRTGTARA